MAACGRVRRMFRLSAALQLLLLVAAGAQKLLNQGGHGQGQGQGAGFGGGGPAGQQLLQLPQSSQHQQQPPQQPPQPPFPAGGPPARRGGAGPGGAGGGWKLAEEEFCREDVTRVCPKHTWSNNLAVLECLQDVRENFFILKLGKAP
nr:Golgi apparatus protein 1 [Manis javanica]